MSETKPMTLTEQTLYELDTLIRARVPIIWLVTQEEARVVNALTHFAQNPIRMIDDTVMHDRYNVWRWTITEGIQPLVWDDELRQACLPKTDAELWHGGPMQGQTHTPSQALSAIVEHATGIPSDRSQGWGANLVLMLDIHRYLAPSHAGQGLGGPNAFQYVRMMRDTYQELLATSTTVIMISPVRVNLLDVEHQVHVIDWPLPSVAEMEALVDNLVETSSPHIPCELDGGNRQLAEALAGLTQADAETAFLTSVRRAGQIKAGAQIPHILKFKREAIQKVPGFELKEHDESLHTLGGFDNLKAMVGSIHETMTREALEAGIEPLDGILLVGVPGGGKSLAVKCIAGRKLPCIRQDVSAQYQSLLGGTEGNFRAGFKMLESMQVGVWWIDEIEKAFGGGGEVDGGTAQRVLGSLLTWMEERKAVAPHILPVVTANDVLSLPDALRNRFELVFYVDFPAEEECRQILRIHANEKRSLNLPDSTIYQCAMMAHRQVLNGREIERCVKGTIRALRGYLPDIPVEIAEPTLLAALQSSSRISVAMQGREMDQRLLGPRQMSLTELRAWAKENAVPVSAFREEENVPAPRKLPNPAEWSV